MHRNTLLLVVVLALFAALVAGVNIGRTFSNQIAVSPTPTPTTIALPQPKGHTVCGISIAYPDTLSVMPSASGSALLIDTVNSNNSVVITCQKSIPRPDISDASTSAVPISSISATLYKQQDIHELIFTHPTSGLDIMIAGIGDTFDAIIQSIKLL